LIFRVQDKEVTFNIFQMMKSPSDVEKCFKIDTEDKSVAMIQRRAFKVARWSIWSAQVHQIRKHKSWETWLLFESCPAKLDMKKVKKSSKNPSRPTSSIHKPL